MDWKKLPERMEGSMCVCLSDSVSVAGLEGFVWLCVPLVSVVVLTSASIRRRAVRLPPNPIHIVWHAQEQNGRLVCHYGERPSYLTTTVHAQSNTNSRDT